MNSNSLRLMRGQLLREAITLLLFAGLMLQSMQAAAPGWWSTRGVFKSGATVDDFAVLNQGQLKNLVRAAVEEMEDKLYYGAGDQARTMLDTWRAQSNNAADDYAAVTVGQLKAAALPLYQVLQDAGMPLPMPWTETTTDDDDYALATTGQAKFVFSFRVPDVVGQGTVDSDGDGFSDAVEIAMGSNPFSASSLPSTVVAYTGAGGASGGTVPVNNTTFYDTPELVGESKGLSRFREGYRGEQTKTNRYKQQKWEWDLYFSNPDTNVKGSHTWTYDPKTGNTSETGDDTSILYSYLEYGSGPWIIQSDTVKITDNSSLGAPPGKVSKLTETLSDLYSQPDLVSGVDTDLPAFSGTFNPVPWTGDSVALYIKEWNDDGVQAADFCSVTRCQYKWKIQAGDPRTVVWTESFVPSGSQQPTKVTPMFWNPASGGGGSPQESPVYTIDPRYSPYLNDGNGSYRLKRINADLDVYSMVDGVQNYDLDDAYEDAVGAFVPVNKDDDDDDGSVDKDQSGASPRTPGGKWVNGQWQALNWGDNSTDTDLLPITTRGSSSLGGTGVKYRLDIPSQIRVWRNPDRSDEVTAASADIDTDRNVPLFVEGVTAGTCILKMAIYNAGTVVVAEADSVKITVFDWAGPCNVPGYSIHKYSATGMPATAKWLPPQSGTINKYLSTADVNIHWPAGPVVGQARLYVSPEYTWPLEVNVVQVDIDFTAGNSLAYHSNPTQDTRSQANLPLNAGDWRKIRADDPGKRAVKGHSNISV